MANKFIKYISLIFLASFFVNNANADGVLAHRSLSDGKNYFKIKGGLAKPNNIGGNTVFNNNNTTFGNGNTNLVIGASVGRKVLDFLFVDLEYMHFGKDKESYSDTSTPQTTTWNIQSDILMANLRLNLLKNFEIMPYIKAGAGVSRNQSSSYNNVTPSISTLSYGGKTINSFAWQLGVGMSFEYNELLGTELEYTYVNRGTVRTQSSYIITSNGIVNTPVNDGGKKGTLKDNIITFGVKFKF